MDRLAQTWPPPAIPQKMKQVQAVEVDGKGEILLLDGLAVIRTDTQILPLLRGEHLSHFPSIIVDPGAIRFICNGADVMRPGVVGMTSFSEGQIVAVKEAKYGKFIAIGLATSDSTILEKASSGKVVKNLHYVGDQFWEAFKEINGTI